MVPLLVPMNCQSALVGRLVVGQSQPEMKLGGLLPLGLGGCTLILVHRHRGGVFHNKQYSSAQLINIAAPDESPIH